MRYASLLTTLLLSVSCQKDPNVELALDNLHYTPNGIPVSIGAPLGYDDATIDTWVDLRLEEWIEHKDEWGCGQWTDEELRAFAKKEPAIVYPGHHLPAPKQGYGAWNYYESGEASRILVTLNMNDGSYDPFIFRPYDPPYMRTILPGDFTLSYGLGYLPHEWTHTVRGAWHQ